MSDPLVILVFLYWLQAKPKFFHYSLHFGHKNMHQTAYFCSDCVRCKIEVFFSLLKFELHILLCQTIWAIKAWWLKKFNTEQKQCKLFFWSRFCIKILCSIFYCIKILFHIVSHVRLYRIKEHKKICSTCILPNNPNVSKGIAYLSGTRESSGEHKNSIKALIITITQHFCIVK